jgi:hypothetical protein
MYARQSVLGSGTHITGHVCEFVFNPVFLPHHARALTNVCWALDKWCFYWTLEYSRLENDV